MVNNAALADSAERYIELLFAPYLTSALDQRRRKRIPESDVRQVSDALRRMGEISWSRVPRIYTILRIIDQIQVIDSFVAQGVSDVWFPFTQKSLPDVLRNLSSRSEFLAAQDLVLTKAFDLEREDGKHRHFASARDVPLRKIEELGKGGSGYVDRVVSTITHREYARKLIPRGRTFRKDVQILKAFERELGHLKRLSHIHIVELVGSYTEPRFVGLIMSPVAECNLKDFLTQDPISSGDRSFLRTFFGCLAEALCYLHDNQIRHKDIKPQNVLVKGHQILLTDFGISLDWSEFGSETTSGPTMKTPRYCAPEVADFTRRNSFSDIWSLGCVFLEMWTVLQGGSISSLFSYLESNGSKSTCYFLNTNTALAWCFSLKENSGTSEDNTPLLWIARMMKHDQDDRWTARVLLNNIDEVNADPENRFAFSGLCCMGNDESTDNTCSSKRTSAALDETNESQIGARSSSTKILIDAMGQRIPKSEPIFPPDHQSQKTDMRLLRGSVNNLEGQAHTNANTGQLTAAAPGIEPTSERDLNEQRVRMEYLNQEFPVESDDIRMDETSGNALNAQMRTSGSLRLDEHVQGKTQKMRDAILHKFEDDEHHSAASILPSPQAATGGFSEVSTDLFDITSRFNPVF